MQVAFLLLGIIKGSVGLRGQFEEVEGAGDTVKVSLLDSFHSWLLMTAGMSCHIHYCRFALAEIVSTEKTQLGVKLFTLDF